MSINNISLSKIIADIKDTSLLKEILKLYHKSLTDEHQYEAPILVPVLNTRMKICVACNSVMENTQLKTVKKLEELSIKMNQSLATLASLFAVVNTTNFDSKINKYIKENLETLKPLTLSFSRLFLNFNTQVFKESEVDFEDLQKITQKLTELIDKGIYEEDWLIKQLNDVKKELRIFSRRTYDKKWREEMASIFEQYSTEHIKIIEQAEYIITRKATNPLISDEIVNLSTEIAQQFNVILTQINTAINSIYKYECETEKTNNAITNYIFLSDKVTKKSDRDNKLVEK